MGDLLNLAEHFESESLNWRGQPIGNLLHSMAELLKSHAYGDLVRAQTLSSSLVKMPIGRVN
jgi:hypothetical protein